MKKLFCFSLYCLFFGSVVFANDYVETSEKSFSRMKGKVEFIYTTIDDIKVTYDGKNEISVMTEKLIPSRVLIKDWKDETKKLSFIKLILVKDLSKAGKKSVYTAKSKLFQPGLKFQLLVIGREGANQHIEQNKPLPYTRLHYPDLSENHSKGVRVDDLELEKNGKFAGRVIYFELK
jgi:hypothetical protein